MARSKSSAQWLRRHVTDPYVKRAQAQGYRSRSAFKLLEIDQRERILKPGAIVVDLGAAPGGWSQVAAQKVGAKGKVVAIDRLEIAPLAGVTVLQGDFRDERTREAVAQALGGRKADVILCDLSPDLTGIASTDQARAAELVSIALEFCRAALEPRGTFLVKVFQGESFKEVLAATRATLREVNTRKPDASRAESRETYLVGRGLRDASRLQEPD
jgi:23S rRNA (uridine2552-2'-O)-methyltransferase